jgi:hypothetical protein
MPIQKRTMNISGGGSDGHGCTGSSKEEHKISNRRVVDLKKNSASVILEVHIVLLHIFS